MKKVGEFLRNIIFVAYAIMAMCVTLLLLSYNDYHCSEIGGYTFILVKDEELEPDYNKGDLVLVKETKAKYIEPGDNIFLYRNITTNQYEIKYAEVLMKDEQFGQDNVQYILEGSAVIDHKDVIGSLKT